MSGARKIYLVFALLAMSLLAGCGTTSKGETTATASVNATTAAGSETGPINGQFTVTLDTSVSTSTTVNYSVGGTATGGNDYTALSGSVVIAAGATSATIPVAVVDDSVVEGSETVVVTLTSTSDAAVGVNTTPATVTIADNDSAQVSIAAGPNVGNEAGPVDVVFTVSLSNPSSSDTTVDFTVAGSATSGLDYTALPSMQVTIPANQASADVVFTTTDDAIVESTENVDVTLNSVVSGDPDITVGATNNAAVNILDNDSANATIAATIDGNEAGLVSGEFRISLTKQASTDTTVSYSVSGGTATLGNDYTAVGGSVVIGAGNTVALIPVPILQDGAVEGNETVVVSLTGVSGDPDIVLGAPLPSATVTILDDDQATASIAATTPGNETGPTAGVFTVSLDKVAPVDTVVSYAVQGSSTATIGTDYTALSGTVTIPANTLSQTISVPVTNDFVVEDPETVVVVLTGTDTGLVVVNAAPATLTIVDDDTAAVTIEATVAAASEGGANGEFTVRFTNPASTPTTVNYTITGSASNGNDYTTLSNTVVVDPGNTNATIVVAVIDDNTVESSENVILTVTGTDKPGIIDPNTNPSLLTAQVDITDNDTATASIAATSPNASEPGTDGAFTISLSNPSSTDTTITYGTGGTAIAGTDYTALSGTVVIPAGATDSAPIPVAVTDDNTIELTEDVVVTLSAVTVGDPDISVGGSNSDTVTIADDDSATVSIVATTPNASEPGTNGEFTISLSNPSSTPTWVYYTVDPASTATQGSDYATLSGAVQIPAGPAGTATIPVQILADPNNLVEGDETVILTLTSTGNAVITVEPTANSDTVTIADDDSAQVSITAGADGDEQGPVNGLFTVSLTNPSASDTTVDYTVVGTATEGSDYPTITTKSVTIPANTTSANITIVPTDDAVVETTENVDVTVNSVVSGDPDITVGATNNAVINILDNDTATATISPTTPNAAEPATNGQFTVTLDKVSSTATVVSYSITTGGLGDAVDTVDFTLTPVASSVTVPAGVSSATIDVTVVDDNKIETSEQVQLTLTTTDNPTKVSVDTTPAAVNIADDDTATATIEVSLNGTEVGPAQGVFTVRLGAGGATSSTPTNVSYSVSAAGTATSGSDFTIATGPVTIPADTATATIPVVVNSDALPEGIENVVVTLVTTDNPSKIGVSTTPASMFITDQDVPAGVLDAAFGAANGIAVHDNAGGGGSPNEDHGYAVAVDPSTGNIYVAGSSSNGTDLDMALWRFTSAGVLDTTFNNPTGYVTHNNAAGGGGDDVGQAVAVDASGNIVVAGYSTNGSGDLDTVVWRYTSAGALDTTNFNNPTGFVVHNNAAGGNGDDVARGVTIDGSGNIVVAGSSFNGTDLDTVVWRYTSAGALDTTNFNNPTGFVTHNNAAGGNGNDEGYAVAIDGSGNIVVAGASQSLSGADMAVWRYTSAGALDTAGFGASNGYFTHNGAAGGNGDDVGDAVTFDASGNILVAGRSANLSANADMALWRVSTSGALDTTFAGGVGYVTHDNAAGGSANDEGRGVTVDAAGNVVVAGYSNNGTDDDTVVWRYTATGVLDVSFGDEDPASTDPADQFGFTVYDSGGPDAAYGVTMMNLGTPSPNDDRILAVGELNGLGQDMALWQFQ